MRAERARGQVKKQKIILDVLKDGSLYVRSEFFVLLLCSNVDGFLALMPSWKAATRYAGITTDIDSYNKLPENYFCIFFLPMP